MSQTTIIDVFSQVNEGSVSFASGSGINVVETDLQTYNALTTKDPTTLYVITSLEPPSSSSSSSL